MTQSEIFLREAIFFFDPGYEVPLPAEVCTQVNLERGNWRRRESCESGWTKTGEGVRESERGGKRRIHAEAEADLAN